MKQELDDIERRLKALRLTADEFRKKTGIERVRWWRAFADKGGMGARGLMKFVRECEEALDALEAPCSLCSKMPKDRAKCQTFGCPVEI